MQQDAPPTEHDLRRASMVQMLHWLAAGRMRPQHLADACMDAYERLNPVLGAFVDVRPALVQDQVIGAGKRREKGVIGRLDGIPVAIKDNIDMAGWPTRAGLPGREGHDALHDAHVVSRLRAAGAVLMGKTSMDEGALGATGRNAHGVSARNPMHPACVAGGSSGGTVVAVATGMAAVGIGTDSLGSIRIPASYCGVYALRPTHGEISMRGVVPAARRLDTIGLVARGVDDLVVLLQVLAGYDADDPRSRHRRVAFAPPDWEPGRLRTGILPDLRASGVESEVADCFDEAISRLPFELGERRQVDFSDWDFARTRRAGLMLMETEMLETFAADLDDSRHPVSTAFRAMLDYARGLDAVDHVAADRVLDEATLKMRRLFAQVDVLVLPTTPQAAFPLDAKVPDNQADLTSFASLAGCPAVSIPMGATKSGLPTGLQFVGPRGSDLRLLELAQICAASLDTAPEYPIEPPAGS